MRWWGGTGFGPDSGGVGGMTRAGVLQHSGSRDCSQPAGKNRGGGLLHVLYCLGLLISEQVLQAGEDWVPGAGGHGPTMQVTCAFLLEWGVLLAWWLVCRAGLNGLMHPEGCFVSVAAVTPLIVCLCCCRNPR